MARPRCRPCTAAIARCARPSLTAPSATSPQVRPLHHPVVLGRQQQPRPQLQQPLQYRKDAAAWPLQSRLAFVPAPEQARSYHSTPSNAGIAERLGGMARDAVKRTIEPYGAFGATRQMYKRCTQPAAYDILEETRRNDQVPTTEDGEELGVGGGFWHDELHLLPSFSTWSQVTMLHMYLLITRLRCFDKETYKLWQSMLSDHFFQEAEDKMDRLHHITSRGLRQRHLQDLFMAWRGVIVAYDEGLMRGDAVLAAAVWRNLFKARPDIDLRHLAAVVAWMRRSFAMLDRMPDESVILHAGSGLFTWAPPSVELDHVNEPATKELQALMLAAQQKAVAGVAPDAQAAGQTAATA